MSASTSSDTERLVRAVWTGLAEPGDNVADSLLAQVGPVPALAAVLANDPAGLPDPATTREAAARRAGIERWRSRLGGNPGAGDLVAVAEEVGGAMVEAAAAVSGRLVVPGDVEWPTIFHEAPYQPQALWVAGSGSLGDLLQRSVVLTGSRAASPYGEHVASELAVTVAGAGVTVVAGAAFGIDAAAHRAALAVGSPTVAVVATGVDRPYPAAHEKLWQRINERDGVLVSALPPGTTATRWRMLERNRLMAMLTPATVVVEAAWRSSALSSATHARALGRGVGAVPGPVTSSTSAGCHRLMRELGAACITDGADVLALLG